MRTKAWMPDVIAQFAGAKYLNLETFRKTGIGVRTPVWFAQGVLHSAPTIPRRVDQGPGLTAVA